MGSECCGRVCGVGFGPTPLRRSGLNLSRYTLTSPSLSKTTQWITELETLLASVMDQLSHSEVRHEENLAQALAQSEVRHQENLTQALAQLDARHQEQLAQSNVRHQEQMREMMLHMKEMFAQISPHMHSSQPS